MTQLFLVRHAASSGQAPDAPLTEAGLAQADALAQFLGSREVARIIASPYLRAVQTIEPFAAISGKSIELDERLVEHRLSALDLPDWREQLRASFSDLDRCLEGGESSRAARARALTVVGEAAAAGRPTVLVTHGKLLALLLGTFDASVDYEFWEKLSNPDVFVVQARARSFQRIWRTE
jgi:2,3-bisphosphoglycerate-dependent phosphoglycerate mutase